MNDNGGCQSPGKSVGTWLNPCDPPSPLPPVQPVPSAVKALIASCWAADPDARPEFEDIVEALESINHDCQATVTRETAGSDGCCCACAVQ